MTIPGSDGLVKQACFIERESTRTVRFALADAIRSPVGLNETSMIESRMSAKGIDLEPWRSKASPARRPVHR